MYSTVEDFLKDWENESQSTLKVFNSLTDNSLVIQVTPKGRSLGFLAKHITASIGEMLKEAGYRTDAVIHQDKIENSVASISDEYKRSSGILVNLLKEEWNDESLKDMIPMYGEEWSKEMVLVSLIKHQIHHRAQMTVLMRQAGLKVPGIYGPSYEEWADYNMEPMQ
jgi:uncharacterized damage-inducible protein DinB